MASLEIPDIPEAILDRLRNAAKQHGHRVDEEALACIARGLESGPQPSVRAASILERARRVRAMAPNAYLTDDALRRARDEGRA